MSKRILVTGGAGFIGSHLCEYLLKRDNEVICVDNFFTGSKSNVSHLVEQYPDRFEVIRHDITLPLYIEIDQIYNLACPASPIHYQYNAIKTIKCSTLGMINMLGLAKRTGARILQASTSEVYGDPLEHPQKETYWGNVNPIGIRSCYDEGKRVAEALCMDYRRKHGVETRIARIFNTYGPRMSRHDGRVISNFIVQALENEDITIYGDGSQTRSFQYVDDLVKGLTALMDEHHFVGPVNIGNPKEFSIDDVAHMVLDLVRHTKSKVVYKELPQDDPRRRQPDISLATKHLNWKPYCDLHQGLRHTIDYFECGEWDFDDSE